MHRYLTVLITDNKYEEAEEDQEEALENHWNSMKFYRLLLESIISVFSPLVQGMWDVPCAYLSDWAILLLGLVYFSYDEQF